MNATPSNTPRPSHVKHIIRRLTQRDRLVAVLMHVDGLTELETSQVLDLSIEDIRTAMARVRRIIMRAIDGTATGNAAATAAIPPTAYA